MLAGGDWGDGDGGGSRVERLAKKHSTEAVFIKVDVDEGEEIAVNCCTCTPMQRLAKARALSVSSQIAAFKLEVFRARNSGHPNSPQSASQRSRLRV